MFGKGKLGHGQMPVARLEERIFFGFYLTQAEVISYNKKNFERELQNESRQRNRQQSRTKRREEELR